MSDLKRLDDIIQQAKWPTDIIKAKVLQIVDSFDDDLDKIGFDTSTTTDDLLDELDALVEGVEVDDPVEDADPDEDEDDDDDDDDEVVAEVDVEDVDDDDDDDDDDATEDDLLDDDDDSDEDDDDDVELEMLEKLEELAKIEDEVAAEVEAEDASPEAAEVTEVAEVEKPQ